MSAVAAAHGVPADSDGVQEGGAAAGHADFCAGDVIPANGNFERPIAEVLGDVEHFNVEPEAVQGLAAEDLAGGGAFEELEAALRVVKRQTRDRPHPDIEKA